MDSNLLDCSIPWSEVIENFAPPERSSKLQTTSMSSMSSMNAMSSMNSMNAMNSMGSSGLSAGASCLEEGKRISTPKARLVNRKRRIVCREEKIGREEKAGKRSRVMEEDAYYLKMNTENLQALKAHLESVEYGELAGTESTFGKREAKGEGAETEEA